MSRRTQWAFARPLLELLCALLQLLLVNAFAAPLTFKHAVELAARNGATNVASEADQEKVCQAFANFKNLTVLQSLVGSAVDYSAELPMALDGAADAKNQPALSSLRPFGRTFHTEGPLAEQDRDHRAVLDTAVAYSELSWANLHLDVLKQQHESATRLVSVEKMRVVAEVDSEVRLVRARLLEAQTRMRSANLQGRLLELRRNLANLTGLPEQQIEPVPESIPPLPEQEELSATELNMWPQCEVGLLRLQEEVKEMIAARDSAQLVYLLVHRDAVRTVGLGPLGEQLASQVREDEKLGALLDAIFELQETQFELLNLTGELEKWATLETADKTMLSQTQSNVGLKTETVLLGRPQSARGYATKGATQSGDSPIKIAPPSLKTLLVLPSDGILTVRGCRQLAAVGIGDGGAKDVTSVVKWSSSNESVAVVSTSGLITGLRSGHVTISASLAGVSRLKLITINEEVLASGK